MIQYSILLVDDHQILLDGTKNIISSYDKFYVKNTAHTGSKALDLIKKEDFDILITDYQLSDLTGLDIIKAVKISQPEMKTIVLSMHDDPSVVRELLAEGIDGYVLKKESSLQLVRALEKVIEGRRYLSDDISDILVHQLTNPEEKPELTPREIEIVRLIAKEYSSKQIAEILFISEKTVETHRKNILRKTKVGSIVGLIKYAYTHKLIDSRNPST